MQRQAKRLRAARVGHGLQAASSPQPGARPRHENGRGHAFNRGLPPEGRQRQRCSAALSSHRLIS